MLYVPNAGPAPEPVVRRWLGADKPEPTRFILKWQKDMIAALAKT